MKKCRTMRIWTAVLFTIAVFTQVSVFAQNSLEVSSIRSPQFDFNYEASDSVNVEIVMVNKGPNTIFATDLIYFIVQVSSDDTSLFYNVSRYPLTSMNANDAQVFNLMQNLKFDSESNHQICVDVTGSDQYPSNTSKNRERCISFVVGIEENALEASKIFYRENNLHFQLNDPIQGLRYRILDLSGKVLKNGTLSVQKEHIVGFDPPARGLYFMQLQAENGQQSTAKFVVK